MVHAMNDGILDLPRDPVIRAEACWPGARARHALTPAALMALACVLTLAAFPALSSEAPPASSAPPWSSASVDGLLDGRLNDLDKVRLVHRHFRQAQIETGPNPAPLLEADMPARQPGQHDGAVRALRQRVALVGAGVPAHQLRLFYVNASAPEGPLAIDLVLAYLPGVRGQAPLILDPRGAEPRPATPRDELTPVALSTLPGAWGEARPLDMGDQTGQGERLPLRSVQVRAVSTGVVRVPVSVVR